MIDYETLGERALDVLTTLTGSPETARAMSQALAGRGALGEHGYYNTFGGIWGRTELSRRDRSLVVICFNSAFERTTELEFHLRGGLNHGLRVEELDELVMMLATYAGAPAAINASAALDRVVAKREGGETRRDPGSRLELKSPEKRRADGLDVLRTLLSHLQLDPRQLETSVLRTGFVGELVLDWAFGDIWSRPQLSRRDRSVAVVSILAALGLHHELEIHLRGALNHGVTREEIAEIMVTLVGYGGFPRAIDGLRVAGKVFEAADVKS